MDSPWLSSPWRKHIRNFSNARTRRNRDSKDTTPSLYLSCTVLVLCWDAEGGEDVFGLGGFKGGGGCEVVAVEVDGDVLEGFEGADDAFDADPGGVLDVAGLQPGRPSPPPA